LFSPLHSAFTAPKLKLFFQVTENGMVRCYDIRPLHGQAPAGRVKRKKQMNPDTSDFMQTLWQYKPIIIVLLVGGLIVFVLLVVDTHRHRNKQKKRHKRLH
jgi:hypothetical protein